MGRIEQLAEKYQHHIALPWQRTVSGAQRVIMIVYDKELERSLMARKGAFENATREAGHGWFEMNLSNCFAEWMAGEDYRDAYFESPEDLQLTLESEFGGYVAGQIRERLGAAEVNEHSVFALFGVGSLFSFTRVSTILHLIENHIKGRLVVFFPGRYDDNNYRLLDARDGWNYLAVPITLHSTGNL